MKKLKDSQFIRIITKIKNKLFENKKEIGFFLCLVVVGIFFVVHSAEAQTISDIKSGIIDAFSDFLNLLNNVVIKGINFLFEFFLKLAKYNGYVDPETAIVQVGWILVRDVANMFFVVIMLVIAFGTILGLENYQWNKLLGKLIFAAIFINFSNMICGLIIDIAYVFSLTFLNAIVNTAGANLINTVHMDKLNNFDPSTEVENSTMILVSNFVALMFSIILLLTIGAFAIIMLLRMVMLWILIILSPLAFIMQAMPQTQEYAKQWWGKFTKQVLVLPVMVFFLWLTLSTMSGGTIADDLGVGMSSDSLLGSENGTIAQITNFNTMANFFVPIAMLVTALTMVGQMGVVGGGLAGKALDFGKKVATIGTGYALGRKLVGGAVSGAVGAAKKVGKAAAWYAPVIGGEKWVDRGKTVWSNVKASYYRKASGLTSKGIVAAGELAEKSAQLETNKSKSASLEAKEKKLKKEYDKANPEDKERISEELSQVKEEKERLSAARPELERKVLEKQLIVDEEFNKGGGALGWIARQGISTKKHLKKSEKQAEVMEQLAFKRMASDAGGIVFNRSIKDQDRLERGLLEVEEARTKAKDDEYVSKGRTAGLADTRAKFTKWGAIDQESRDGKRMAEQVAGHKRRAGSWQNKQKAIEQGIELKIDMKANAEVERVRSTQEEIFKKLLKPDESELEEAEMVALQNRDSRIEEIKRKYSSEEGKLQEQLYETEIGKQILAARGKKASWVGSDEFKAKKEEIDVDVKKLEGEIIGAEEKFQRDLQANNLALANALKRKKSFDDREDLTDEEKLEKERIDDEVTRLKDNGTKILDKHETEKTGFQASREEILKRSKELIAGKQVDEEIKKLEAQAREDEDAKGIMEQIDNLQSERQVKLDEADNIVAEPRKNLTDFRLSQGDYAKGGSKEGKGKKEWESTEEYKANKAEAEFRALRLEDGLREQLGIGGFIAEEQAVAAETAAKAIKSVMQGGALGLFGINKMAESIAISEQFAAAGEKLKEAVKQTHLSQIFKKGAKELETAITRAQKGYKDAYKNLGPAALSIKSEVENQYLADQATAEKTVAMDKVDSAYSLERFGFGTPSTAFKNFMKKRMDNTFQGVEREQAVTMAFGSLQKLLSIAEKGGELDTDQRAQMEANVAYLTKQAWSDDMLSRITSVINNRDQLHGEKRDQAEALKNIFVDRLKWATTDKDGKQVVAVNHSSYERTNQLHLLAASAGNIDNFQMEQAVLRKMEMSGKGYLDGAESLAKELGNIIKEYISNGTQIDGKAWEDIAKKMGFTHRTGAVELEAFARKLNVSTNSATKAMEKFKEEMTRLSEAKEVMTDFKNYALAAGHLDDGGHTIYDMDSGIARGQLARTAYKFMMSDWIKMNGRDRVNKVKTHSIARMDEDFGTASYADFEAVSATYNGATSRLNLESGSDQRIKKQVLKHAALEEMKKDKNGRLIVGDAGSAILKTYGWYDGCTKEEEQEAIRKAKVDVARDFAAYLNSSPEMLLAFAGQFSGVDYNDAVQGRINLNLFDDLKIDSTDEDGLKKLVEWINKTMGSEEDFAEHNSQFMVEEYRTLQQLRVDFSTIKNQLATLAQKETNKKNKKDNAEDPD